MSEQSGGVADASILARTAAHYGTMRFAMFTVFTAISGTLIAFPFSEGSGAFLQEPLHRSLLSAVGMTLSFFFAMAEYRVSQLVVFYQQAAHVNGQLPLQGEHDLWKHVVLITMLLPYLFAFLFWALYANGTVMVPSR